MFTALRRRPSLIAGIVAGLLVGGGAALFGTLPSTAVLLGWCALAVVHMAPLAWMLQRSTPARLKKRAEDLDDGQWGVMLASLAACIASILAVVWHLRVAHQQNDVSLAMLGILTILLSWLLVHVLFAGHYCHEYWQNGGGIDFPGDEKEAPDFLEFMYFSLTIGMTFQVSDVTTTNRGTRRLVSLHGAISFLFNAVILACTVNMASQYLD
ncbi:DUF1345 domain-containing protein [Acetobacteraceae bacterium H6797]|nr:DUF1345 domain-containing protein [Acetobacteraceae bacterium H6797]